MSSLGARDFAQRFVVALVVTFVLSVATIGGAYWKANDWWDGTATVDVEVDAQRRGEPANFLIIGSDSRSFVDDPTEEEHFGNAVDQTGQRSDVIMIAHIDPETETGMLVSFPRDLWVQVPGIGGAKINAAYNAGPQRVIDTVKQNFDIPVHHYLEVNFEGFRNVVDAVGSVAMFFPAPARDTVAGLFVPEAGCRELDGEQALALARSRSFEYQDGDGEWRSDGTADLGRIQRQQNFLRALADEAVHDVVRNPTRITSILDTALADDNLQRDEGLALSDVTTLIDTFRDVDPAVLEMVTVPTRREFVDGQDAQILIEDEAAPIFQRLRSFGGQTEIPEGLAPADVSVSVLNGAGVVGQARAALDGFAGAGFEAVEPPGNADRSDYRVTEVRHGPDGPGKAQFVLAYLGGAGQAVRLDEAPASADVVVVLGGDYESVSPPATAAATTVPPDGAAEPGGTGPGATSPTAAAEDPTAPRAC